MSEPRKEKNYADPCWLKVPLSELTTPKPGLVVYPPSWWATTPDGCVLFYKERCYPQTNSNPAVVRHLHPKLEATFIPVSFVSPRND